MDQSGYKSCIKIKGIKLLPPVISPQRKIELNVDKKKAIEIEKRLKYERDLKSFIDSLEPSINLNVDRIIERKGPTSLEHKVAFNESNDVKLHRGQDVARVPFDKKNLISYVFDVTEYNKDGIVLLSSDDTASPASPTEALLNCDKIDVTRSEKPKLVRSNSYTLQSPSPALLEYLKNQERENPLQLPRESQLDYSSILYDSACETLEGMERSVDQNGNGKLQESSIMEENFLSFDNETIDSLIKSHFDEIKASPNDINLLDTRLDEMEATLQEFLDRQTSESHNWESSLQNGNRQHDDVTSRSEINSTIFNTSTPLLIDFESDSCENEAVPNFQRNATHNEIDSDPLHVLMSHDDYKRLSSDNRLGCSRQLFNGKENRMSREKWAATVLTAAARGYLVRRLKRTDRVKGLIQTIHDTIICAFNLHRDDVDSIPEADIELHRRLIVQLTSACHDFYDIFFTLTAAERMALIAQDRQRKMYKLKRASLKMKSNQSSAKSQRQSINRMSKSMPPSFAA